MNDRPIRFEEWNSADPEARLRLLRSLEGFGGHPFKLKKITSFGSGEEAFPTGIYELENSEFVFVPGRSLTLGWDGVRPEDAKLAEALRKELETAMNASVSPEELTAYFRDVFSPLREACVPPMLVERRPSRVEAEDGELVHLEEVRKRLASQGFALPTEDEWEALCGQGTRRFFAEHLNRDMLEAAAEDQGYWYAYDLETPNVYGLYIAYDPYLYELVDAPCLVKGGDGGGAAHGGYRALAVLPLSPQYRDPVIFELSDEDGFDFDVHARRIVRLMEPGSSFNV
ncbi:hypothetical protein [Saccharibacillus alkalitolerans]|uniref:Sulfatase-modifying factor enzyme domain-containing protein n=1 Tax=Saccharibacillus alkalitolerans TaxID=2705290 RepID=A0ABX0F1J1_9BACL|nr:hypothetical protein [Saccharibacillus alkalitolerans]NGZ74375.1 hypothetical protein [Saccharibacillus alkalitolerans]